MFAGKKSAQIREILISESAWEEMTCLFAPSFGQNRHTTLKPVNYVSNIKLAFIPKDALKTNSETFRNWFYSAISYGKIISLPDYLKNPAHYHTHHYSHELDSITLGNPSRKYKLIGDS